MSSQSTGMSARDRQKSLDIKFSDPTFLTDEPGFPSVAQKTGQHIFPLLMCYGQIILFQLRGLDRHRYGDVAISLQSFVSICPNSCTRHA